jgi:Zn-dependent M28 family amino/carboxypeptidase
MLRTIRALTGPTMQGRAAGSEGGAAARGWIERQLSHLGIQPFGGSGYARPFAFTTKAGVEAHASNLVAVCQGRRPDAGIIVVSAHYDHLGVRNAQVYHGADDNASGVSMLLQVAARCKATRYRHTLMLAFFDAEEAGLQGARAFLADAAVPVHRIRLNVNFDMVGRSDRREIYIAGPGRWPKLLPLLTAPARQAPVVAIFGHDTGGGHEDWTAQSDHGVFHDAGIPFVYFGVEDHADYHQPTDTPDKISPGFLGGVAALVLDSLRALDGAPAFK